MSPPGSRRSNPVIIGTGRAMSTGSRGGTAEENGGGTAEKRRDHHGDRESAENGDG